MDIEDKTKEYLLKDSKNNEPGFIDETKDNFRHRSTKHTETKENDITPSDMIHEIYERSEGEYVHKVWDKVPTWRLVHYSMLPPWLQDNEFLRNWHRQPLPSFSDCFKSVFKLHTETGNIWTHLVGCVAFIVVIIFFMSCKMVVFEEKLILAPFFVGVILCLGFSTLYHTIKCHSELICKSFKKLDYFGISCLIMGSTVPWLYYLFYCDYISKLIYMSMTTILGTITIIVSLWNKFGTSEYRKMRALAFVIFGLSAVIPAVHFMFIMNWNDKINTSAIQHAFLLASLYILAAALYVARIPERFFPGKCDLWFQSHQIFHVLVVVAAFVTYHGLKELSVHRHMYIECVSVNIPNVITGNLTNDI